MAVSIRSACKCAEKVIFSVRRASLMSRHARGISVLSTHKETPRGQPPGDSKTLEQRLAELNAKDPILDQPINIGLPPKRKTVSYSVQKEKNRQNKQNPELERAARLHQLKVPLEDVRSSWLSEWYPEHARTIADHYGIYRDLFDSAFFLPEVPLTVEYDYDDEFVTPVYLGNYVKPTEASLAPRVDYESDSSTLWTLVLTNPDGHLQDNYQEYLHWFVGNIPGNDLSKGEVLCDYMKPFPPKGTGYHRFIFTLYKQEQHIDFSSEKRAPQCTSLKERTFNTFQFYKSHQDNLTPAGLSFFQSEWDQSVQDHYRNVLDMREPVFEYDFPEPYHPPQRKYPHKEPFNLYLDRYRDVKEIKEQVIKEKLKMISPFEEHPKMPQYPMLHAPQQYVPTWLRREEMRKKLRAEKWQDLPN